MKFIQCSMCRRAAAWVIDKEVFCEGHKELIIETLGVDHFRSIDSRTKMTRSLSVAASLNQTPKEKWRQRLLEVTLEAKVVEIRREPAICSIPLHQAVYC
jgi:hypothetical protein